MDSDSEDPSVVVLLSDEASSHEQQSVAASITHSSVQVLSSSKLSSSVSVHGTPQAHVQQPASPAAGSDNSPFHAPQPEGSHNSPPEQGPPEPSSDTSTDDGDSSSDGSEEYIELDDAYNGGEDELIAAQHAEDAAHADDSDGGEFADVDDQALNEAVQGGRIGALKAAIDNNEPLYPNSEHTTAEWLATLLLQHVTNQCRQGTDKVFEVGLRRDALMYPKPNNVPTTFHTLKRACGVRPLWELTWHLCPCGHHAFPPADPSTYSTLYNTEVGPNVVCPKCQTRQRFKRTESGVVQPAVVGASILHALSHLTMLCNKTLTLHFIHHVCPHSHSTTWVLKKP